MSPVWRRALRPAVRPVVRRAAVAGSFYPRDAAELAATVDRLLEQARLRAPESAAASSEGTVASASEGTAASASEGTAASASESAVTPAPVALVAPHAGYVYSGAVAASAYSWLRDRPVRRVAVLGPAHYMPLTGIAVPTDEAFATPIGEVPVEVRTCAALAERHECVAVDDRPHRPEHSIEVQLPFLQRVLAQGWTCVPLVVGATAPEQVADVLDTLCADGDLLPVVSTDLSHYLDQVSAERRDRHTAQAVVDRDAAAIGRRDACGAFPLRGLLHWAHRHELEVRRLHLGTSADAGADPGRVVGYGAFALLPSSTGQRTPSSRQ